MDPLDYINIIRTTAMHPTATPEAKIKSIIRFCDAAIAESGDVVSQVSAKVIDERFGRSRD